LDVSFNFREIARWLGQPVQLFRFTRQTLAWCYTSADRVISFAGDDYTPLAIERENLRESYERQKRRVTITLPASAAVCDNWRPSPLGDVIGVTILARHRGDDDVAVEWMGRVMQPKFTDSTCELTCDPSSGSARSNGLQLRWQRGCPFALYGQGHGLCNLDAANFAAPAVLESVAGTAWSASAWAGLPIGRLAGGYVEWVSDQGLLTRRSITAHAGAAITVDYVAPGLAAGIKVTAYHGCAHNYADCAAKGNSDNFGGCTKLPVKNPFSGMPIWW
jgi:hypothetical protein